MVAWAGFPRDATGKLLIIGNRQETQKDISKSLLNGFRIVIRFRRHLENLDFWY